MNDNISNLFQLTEEDKDQYRKLIDKKNQQVEIFDLGNHILIIGVILLVVFVSLNVD